jgi:thiamine biosynthesis lipoprotein ApbE
MIIDALTKAILVLGEKKGMEVVRSLKLEALIIVEREGQLFEVISEGLHSNYQSNQESW